MTMKLMIFRLRTEDPDSKGGIWKRLFHNADELDDIFRHKGNSKEKRSVRAGVSYRLNLGCFKPLDRNFPGKVYFLLNKIINVF